MGSHKSFEFCRETYLKLLLAVGILTILNLTPHYSFSQTPPPVTIDGTLQGLAGSGNNAGSRELSGSDITVTREMGLVRGSNLFHSFGRFNVPTDGSVTFNGPSSIVNILSRVTGDDVSNINGKLASTIDAANLYLMNPQGIIFGPNASLNISGSFYATTANNIELADSVQFSAVPGSHDAALLTSAPPKAFGFLGENPSGSIIIDKSSLVVPASKTISIIGGDINVTGSPLAASTLQAPGGNVILTSIAQSTTGIMVRTLDGQPDSSRDMGEVKITGVSDNDPFIDTSGSASFKDGSGGTVVIRGGHILITNVQINTSPSSSVDFPGFGAGKGGDTIIISSENVLLEDSTIRTISNFASGAGAVRIEAGSALSLENPMITSSSDFSNGGSGKISLMAPVVNLSRGEITTTTGSPPILGLGEAGKAGDIDIFANTLTLSNGSEVNSSTTGPGDGGTISIKGLSNNQLTENVTMTSSSVRSNVGEGSAGNAGNINVWSKTVTLEAGSTISSTTDGFGKAGNMSLLTTAKISITGENSAGTRSALSTQSTRTDIGGSAGNIRINNKGSKGLVFISNDGIVSSSTSGSGIGGDIEIHATNITLDKGTTSSRTQGQLNGGMIKLTADHNIFIKNESNVTAESTGSGNAGTISLNAQNILQIEESSVTTRAEQGSGGDISVQANRMIRLTNSTIESSVRGNQMTTGGDISLDPQFVILQNSRILARATSGFGGDIEIDSNIVLADPFSLDPENLSATSEAGPQFSGKVDIRAPIQNLSETIAPLPEALLRVSALFAARCAAQKDGKFSSFIQNNIHGLSPYQQKFLSSPLVFYKSMPQRFSDNESFMERLNSVVNVDILTTYPNERELNYCS